MLNFFWNAVDIIIHIAFFCWFASWVVKKGLLSFNYHPQYNKKLKRMVSGIYNYLMKLWQEICTFFWAKNKPKKNKEIKKQKSDKEIEEITAEFGRTILREVRELGGDEDNLVLGKNFELRRNIAKVVVSARESVDNDSDGVQLRYHKLDVFPEGEADIAKKAFGNLGSQITRQGDFVQVDTGVSVFPDCDTVSVPPKKTRENS